MQKRCYDRYLASFRLVRGLMTILLLLFHLVAWSQFNYTTNYNNTIAITGYTGSGGSVVIPDTINGLPVSRIADSAFFDLISLKEIVLPSGLTSIESEAFRACGYLTNVIFNSNLTYLGNSSFALCYRLTNVVLPYGLQTLGDGAFGNCTGLKSISIPGSVVRIGISAFSGCSSLTNVLIGHGVSTIEDGAFYYCTSLSSITLPKSISSVNSLAFGSCLNLQRVFFRGNRPNTYGINQPFSVSSGPTVVYYLPGTSGWTNTFGGRPALLWNPVILSSDSNFGVHSGGFDLPITGTVGIPIVVESASSPTSTSWTLLWSGSLYASAITRTDFGWTNYPTRFYRIRSP